MDLGLRDKTAVVTAASRGLGRSVAESLATEGARTFICARSEPELRSVALDISGSTGSPVIGVRADLADAGSVDRVADQVLDEAGHVDVFVHVAGGPKLGRFVDKDRSEWDEQFQMHFHSFRQLVSRFLSGMVDSGWGRVVAVTSRTVKQPRVDNPISGAVRLPTISVLRVLANEYGLHGITFNAVCPGPFATDRLMAVCQTKAEEEGTDVEQQLASFAQDVAVGRVGDPKELAAACTFLASEQAGFITGQVVMVDGGSVPTIF